MVKQRTVVGAHYGLRDWLMQRITAAVMAGYTLVLLALIVMRQPLSFDVWKEMFSMQWLRFFSMLFLLCLYLHAWVGVRDILMDYVQRAGVRLLLQVITIAVLTVYAAWSAQILWGL